MERKKLSALGYSFEKMVLYAWSIGIGTTWIGGTMKCELFEKAAETADDEIMMIVSPLGYPAKEQSEVDKKLRDSIHGERWWYLGIGVGIADAFKTGTEIKKSLSAGIKP